MTAVTAGFCMGVQRAVDAVYAEVREAEQEGHAGGISTFGPIIHNEVVVEDLRARGVCVINDPSEIDPASNSTIVIRSHGVTREVYDEIVTRAGKTVDTTCTFVKRIHELVLKAGEAGSQVVIIGNHGHAESEGHLGWALGPAEIIETAEEARGYTGNVSAPVTVVAQTTFNGARFEELVAILRERGYNMQVVNTICNATRERQTEARELASRADVMIVIGGKGSSNTAKLYDICKEECARTYFASTAEELNITLDGSERLIGITAGASTPRNIIDAVQRYVRGL